MGTNNTALKEADSFGRLIEAARPFQRGYVLSIFTAILGVACRVLPFVFISQIILALFSEVRAPSLYFLYLGLMAASYILEAVFSGVSVNVAHSTCYRTLASIRTSVLDKMFTLPLGYVKNLRS